MPVRVHSISSVNHLLAQKIQLPDTDPAVMPTPSCKPMPCPQKPRSKREYPHHAQRNGSIVEGLTRDRILRGKTKDDGDEADPEASDSSDGFGEGTEVEGPAFEVSRPDEAHGDGDAVGDVEAAGGDGGGAVKGDFRAEGGEGEEEGAGGAEEDSADWGVEAAIDEVEAVRDAAVAGEGEHHAGVRCLHGS